MVRLLPRVSARYEPCHSTCACVGRTGRADPDLLHSEDPAAARAGYHDFVLVANLRREAAPLAVATTAAFALLVVTALVPDARGPGADRSLLVLGTTSGAARGAGGR